MTAVDFSSALVDALDRAWGNVSAYTDNGEQWTSLPSVKQHINRLVSGRMDVSPLAWFFEHVETVQALPLSRVLVLGCGVGRVERECVAHGWVDQVVATDLSAKVLQHAKAAAVGLPQITYVQADMDRLPVGSGEFVECSFDAVLGISSVHHCSQLKGLFASLARLLRPGGWLFLDEYVGPDRFQWSPQTLRLVEQTLLTLPEAFRHDRRGQIRGGYQAPSAAEVMAVDPSEAVCSSQILEALRPHFQVLAHRPYGGALLHIGLSDIAQNFSGQDGRDLLESLMSTEIELTRDGELENHFACVIAQSPH